MGESISISHKNVYTTMVMAVGLNFVVLHLDPCALKHMASMT